MKVNGINYNIGEFVYTTRGAEKFNYTENGIMSIHIEDIYMSNGKAYALEYGYINKEIELGNTHTYKVRRNAITALKLKRYSMDFFKRFDNLEDKLQYEYFDKFEAVHKTIHEYDNRNESISLDDAFVLNDFKEPKIIIKESDFDEHDR